jgi:hypothetical protein
LVDNSVNGNGGLSSQTITNDHFTHLLLLHLLLLHLLLLQLLPSSPLFLPIFSQDFLRACDGIVANAAKRQLEPWTVQPTWI